MSQRVSCLLSPVPLLSVVVGESRSRGPHTRRNPCPCRPNARCASARPRAAPPLRLLSLPPIALPVPPTQGCERVVAGGRGSEGTAPGLCAEPPACREGEVRVRLHATIPIPACGGLSPLRVASNPCPKASPRPLCVSPPQYPTNTPNAQRAPCVRGCFCVPCVANSTERAEVCNLSERPRRCRAACPTQ
jgi:hypothetical protein